MALFNYATKEITIKIVYYGPGLSGKTTNLQYLHSVFEPAKRGKLLSLATEADRTLFFDFLPIHLGKISDFSIRFQLYTVPGQVRYNATRKLVLKGADAIVFVADSQRQMREQNMESLGNMRENLAANNIDPDEIPLLLQYNKRDLVDILSIEELNKDLNENGKYDYREAVAIDGNGVEDAFQHITRLVIKGISEKHKIKVQPAAEAMHAEVASSLPVEDKPARKSAVESITLPEMEIEQTQYESSEARGGRAQKPILEFPQQREETPQKHGELVLPFVSEREEFKEFRETPVVAKTKEVDKTVEAPVPHEKEAPAVTDERIESMVNYITGMSLVLKEVKNTISSIQSEVESIRREQKALGAELKEITDTLHNIKTKRKWFSFT
jgi:hypothetical protein